MSELLTLWNGVSFRTHDYGNRIIRCALFCVGCDLPAGRKTCEFLSYTANLGCSRCYCNFGTGQFGKQNYSGFDRTSWILRNNLKHREDVKCTLVHSSKTERQRKESQLGCCYSCFLQLPYFDAVRMLIIDPMHNLYLGTAQYIFNVIWLKGGVISRIGLREINQRIQSWSVTLKYLEISCITVCKLLRDSSDAEILGISCITICKHEETRYILGQKKPKDK